MRTLLTASDDRPAADPAEVDLLLAPLAPELYHFQRNQLGLSKRQITASLGTLADRFLGGPGRTPSA